MNNEDIISKFINDVYENVDIQKTNAGVPKYYIDVIKVFTLFDKYNNISQEENKKLKIKLEEANKKIDTNVELIKHMENQQKEFIKYLKSIEGVEYIDFDDEELKGYVLQRIDTFKEILKKYQKIIGGLNE